ncbi:MAG TPA: hypothetical protein PKE06_10125 [Flavilitoribacter sp.]|nr:hypothetical protein [Flavilitoribacter sp.]HMQ86322.1 hypothetical protein [Flavilitoribacter sp.]
MTRNLLLPGLAALTLLVVISGCQKEGASNLGKRNDNSCNLSGKLDGEHWCGELEAPYINDVGDLVLNATNFADKEGVDFDQVTLYFPDFSGVGTYDLLAEDAVYREWCCFDMLVTCIYAEENTGLDRAIVESYDPVSGAIRGSFYFQVEKGGKAVEFTEGRFEGVVQK